MLLLNERKKNDPTKHYMVIQGILQSLKEKAGYYATMSKTDNPNKEQFAMITSAVYADYKAMMQSLMGVLKSFGLKKELPFDVEEFLKKGNAQSTDQSAH